MNIGPNIRGLSFGVNRNHNKIQYDGNTYDAGSRNLAGCKKRYGCSLDLYTNKPLKMSLTFYGILKGSNNISSLSNFGITGIGTHKSSFNFQNVPIEWKE